MRPILQAPGEQGYSPLRAWEDLSAHIAYQEREAIVLKTRISQEDLLTPPEKKLRPLLPGGVHMESI